MLNRRQALCATASGLLLAGRSPKAQTQSVTFDDISIDPGIISGQQQALAGVIQASQANPSGPATFSGVDPSLIDNAISWSQVWSQVSASSGLSARVDQLLDASDPNGLSIVVLSNDVMNSLQQQLASVGIDPTSLDLSSIQSFNFTDVSIANQQFGGFAGVLDFFNGAVLPSMYPPSSPTGSLAQVRRNLAVNWRLRKKGVQLATPPSGCTGLNYADSLLSGIAGIMAIPAYFGCVPCLAISLSNTLVAGTVKIVKVIVGCH